MALMDNHSNDDDSNDDDNDDDYKNNDDNNDNDDNEDDDNDDDNGDDNNDDEESNLCSAIFQYLYDPKLNLRYILFHVGFDELEIVIQLAYDSIPKDVQQDLDRVIIKRKYEMKHN